MLFWRKAFVWLQSIWYKCSVQRPYKVHTDQMMVMFVVPATLAGQYAKKSQIHYLTEMVYNVDEFGHI